MAKRTYSFTRQKKRRSSWKSTFGLSIAIILVALIGGSLHWYFQRTDTKHQQQARTVAHTAPTSTPTHAAKSDGSTFSVPDTVPKGAIVNYALITQNSQYEIQYNSQDQTYTITLYAIVNNPHEYNSYLDQLRQYKQSALAYLKSKGINVTKVKIIYDPTQAAQL